MKAVLYARFSPRPGADKCESIEVQVDRCRAYCRAHAYEIVGEHEDREMSGGQANNRPGLQAAVEQACHEKAILVVYKLDRMARDASDALDIAKRLKRAKGAFASVTEEINTNGYMGKLIFTILAAVAEMQKAMISERTADSMRFHQQNGRRMSRPDRPPFGQRSDVDGPTIAKIDPKTGERVSRPARLLDCPEERAIIGQILAMRDQGLKSWTIMKKLNEAGVPYRGKKWFQSHVQSILKRAAS